MSLVRTCSECGALVEEFSSDGLCGGCRAAGSTVRAPDQASADPTAHSTVQRFNDSTSEHIGHYKLLQKIGEGGFGVVYLAEQEQPVKRRGALKVIKLGMDTRQVGSIYSAQG